jgi:hypothetical protein
MARGSGEPPYLFIVGCARSGTTLLHRIVDAHPMVTITPEMHWISKRPGADGGRDELLVTPEVVSELADHKRFSQFGLDREDFEGLLGPGESVPYREFLARLFELYGRVREKPLVGNKTPSYVRHLPELHGSWPEARFVHIVRDGRDVCLSVHDWGKGATRFSTFRDDPVTTTAVWWEWYVRLGREDGSRLPVELYHELRYEDLVARPEDECRRLCDFLELEYDAAMLRFHEGRERDNPELTAKKAWKPVTRGLRSWRAHMSYADVVSFEAAAGELLEELGYDRAAPDLRAADVAHAARIRGAFVDELRRRRRRAARAWSDRTPATVQASSLEA